MFSRVLGELLRMAQTGKHKLLCSGMNHASARCCVLAWEMLLAYKNKSTLCVDMIERLNILDGVTVARASEILGWRTESQIDLWIK